MPRIVQAQMLLDKKLRGSPVAALHLSSQAYAVLLILLI